jgi:hypothetical protein
MTTRISAVLLRPPKKRHSGVKSFKIPSIQKRRFHVCILPSGCINLCHSLYLLTTWKSVLLEKLTGFQLVKKFPAIHGTRRFITTVTSARYLSLS